MTPGARGGRRAAWRPLVRAARGLAVALALLCAAELALMVAGVGADEPFFVERVDGLGRRWMVSNERVGANWYAPLGWPPAIGIPRPERFPAGEDPDTYRVFVVGGSAAYGALLEDHVTWASQLEAVLEMARGDRRVEVINCGLRGAALSVFPAVVREVTRHDADLIVVYAGHNEYYGAHRQPWWRRRRVVRLLARAAGRRRVGDAAYRDHSWYGDVPAGIDGAKGTRVGMPLDADHPPGDPIHEAVVRRFLRDLDRVIAASGDVPVLVYTIHGAEREISPLVPGEPPPGIDAALLRELTASVEAEPYDIDPRLAERVDALAARAPEHAGLAHLQGLVRLARGDAAGAREALGRSIELDGRPVRAKRALDEGIRALARRHGERVRVCDVEEALRRLGDQRILDRHVFLDHVHPTIDAGYVLADAGARALADDPALGLGDGPVSWPTREQVRERLGITVADEVLSLRRAEDFFHRSVAMTVVESRSWRLTQLHTRQQALLEEVDPLERQVLLQLHPGEQQLHLEMARVLAGRGEDDRALEQARVAVLAAPGSPPAELALARMLHRGGDDDGARHHLALALMARPDVPGGADLARELGLGS